LVGYARVAVFDVDIDYFGKWRITESAAFFKFMGIESGIVVITQESDASLPGATRCM
jgi:hypothetical protein